MLGLTKMVVTVNDHLDRLDKTDAKLEERLERLADKVATLATAVGNISGQLATIEKRLDDRDKLVAATIELEVLKATEKLRAEFRRQSGT